jgi:hypothetical protein
VVSPGGHGCCRKLAPSYTGHFKTGSLFGMELRDLLVHQTTEALGNVHHGDRGMV